jgi:hypothetical protein
MRRTRPKECNERVAALMRERWADPHYRARMTQGRWGERDEWQPPQEHRELFADLRAKFGPGEARRLVEDHMRVVERRKAAAVRRELHGAGA